MADLSTHRDSLDLAAENEFLQMQSKEQIEKLESLNQEVHSLRNRLQVSRKVEAHCQSEVESLQEQLNNASASQNLLILNMKEEHAKTIEELELKVQALEKDLQDMQEKYKLGQAELRKARKELTDVQEDESIASLKVQLQELLEEHASNRMACIQHRELNEILIKEKTQLQEELCATREHVEVTEEKLKICKADLKEQSETVEEIRDSLAVAQNELACLKANPSDSVGRGNSLFAEVEDKRQSMLKKCSSLSKKYSEMKRDYSSKCSEISRLRLENLKLRRKWQEEEEERDKRDIWLNDNYEIRIKELTKLMEDLKKEEKPVYLNGDSKILTYAEKVVEDSRRKLAQLRDEMEWRSSERLNEAKALYTARCEMQILKTQMMSLQAENIVLRDRLQNANIFDIPSPGKTCFKQICDQKEDCTSSGNSQMESNSEEFSSKKIKILNEDPSTLTSAIEKQRQSQILTEEDESLNEPNSNDLHGTSTRLPASSPLHSQTESSTAVSLAAELGVRNGVESPSVGYLNDSFSGSLSPSVTDLTNQDNVTSRDKHDQPNNSKPLKICAVDEDCDIGTSFEANQESLMTGTKSLEGQSLLNGSLHSSSGNDEFTPLASELALGAEIETPCNEHFEGISEDKGYEIEEIEIGSDSEVNKPQQFIQAEFLQKQEICSRQSGSDFFHHGEGIKELLSSTAQSESASQYVSTNSKMDSHHTEREQTVQAIKGTEFVYPNVMKPMHVSKAETKENLQFMGKYSEICGIQSENDVNSPPVLEETCTAAGDQLSKMQSVLATNTRSILTKLSRPCLVPLDQNLKTRKVSFAITENTETSSCEPEKESIFKDPAKKRLTRLPQPKTFKTRVIVSKENDDD